MKLKGGESAAQATPTPRQPAVGDRRQIGEQLFDGELILFGSAEFPDWDAVLAHLDVQG